MAQAGYTPISLYYSTTAAAVPVAGNLVPGELAININDGKLYFENSSGVVTLLSAASGASATVQSVSVTTANGFAGTVATATTTPAITLSTTITGLLKGNGTAISAATPGTDYAPATSGTSILKGSGTGTFSNAVSGTDYAPATSGTSILKGNGSGGFSNAVSGTDYGTVSSVTVSGTNITVSGSPITTTGTINISIPQAITTTSNVQFGSFGVGTAASGTIGEIRATNNVTAFYSSDRNLKENIQDVPNALAIVTAIGSKTFDWTDDHIAKHGGEDGYFVQKSDFGVIAQDVQSVFPQAVRTRKDGTLAVDYEKLSTLAFGAISELLKRIEVLENK